MTVGGSQVTKLTEPGTTWRQCEMKLTVVLSITDHVSMQFAAAGQKVGSVPLARVRQTGEASYERAILPQFVFLGSDSEAQHS